MIKKEYKHDYAGYSLKEHKNGLSIENLLIHHIGKTLSIQYMLKKVFSNIQHPLIIQNVKSLKTRTSWELPKFTKG